MTRPVTSQERARIEAACRNIDAAQRDLKAAERERDLAILDAYNRRAKVIELAQIAGLSRQTVHAIINQLAEESDPDED
jgi:hypothetical protein